MAETEPLNITHLLIFQTVSKDYVNYRESMYTQSVTPADRVATCAT